MSNSIYNKDKTLPNFAQVGYEEWKKKQEAKNNAANIDPLDGIDPGGAKAGYDGVYDKLPKAVTEQKPAAPTTSTSPSTGYVPNFYVPEEDRELYDKTRLGLTTGANAGTKPKTEPESAPVTAPKVDTPSPEDFGLSVDEFTGFTYDDFQYSEAYKNAMAYTNQLLSQLSSGRTSYTDQINGLLKEYKDRDAFSYDASNDMLFQQMLASSMNSGQMVMADTMGQAAALTGGYGNTYGQAVGNAAYNQYISEAYNNLPQYYGLALDAYNAEGDKLLNELALLKDADAAEYGRLFDAYKANLGAANDMYNREYGEYLDKRNAAEKDYWNNIDYKMDMYGLAEDKARADQDQKNWEADYNYRAERDQKADEYQMAQDLLGLTGGNSEVDTLSYGDLEKLVGAYMDNGGMTGKGNEAVYNMLSLMGKENIDVDAMDEFLETVYFSEIPFGNFMENLYDKIESARNKAEEKTKRK